MTRTLRPCSRATRSATVSPKNPDPTTTRSACTCNPSFPGRDALSLVVTARPGGRVVVAAPAPVHDPAHALRHEPVAAADRDVADLLGGRREAEPAQAPLQLDLRAQEPRAPAPRVRARPHAVAHEGLLDVLGARAGRDHPREEPVVLHERQVLVAARALDRAAPVDDRRVVEGRL